MEEVSVGDRGQHGSQLNNEAKGERGKVVINSLKLQAEVLRLEQLGLIGKWYGVDLN